MKTKGPWKKRIQKARQQQAIANSYVTPTTKMVLDMIQLLIASGILVAGVVASFSVGIWALVDTAVSLLVLFILPVALDEFTKKA